MTQNELAIRECCVDLIDMFVAKELFIFFLIYHKYCFVQYVTDKSKKKENVRMKRKYFTFMNIFENVFMSYLLS